MDLNSSLVFGFDRQPEPTTKDVKEVLGEIEALFPEDSLSSPISLISPVSLSATSNHPKHVGLTPLIIPSHVQPSSQILSAPLPRGISPFSEPSPTTRAFSPFSASSLSPTQQCLSPFSASETFSLFGFQTTSTTPQSMLEGLFLSDIQEPIPSSPLSAGQPVKKRKCATPRSAPMDGKSANIPCPVKGCGKVFLKGYNLVRASPPFSNAFQSSHLKVHSELKPYSCLQCGFAVKRKHDLRRHMRLVHTQCPTCMESFDSSKQMQAHLVEKRCTFGR